MPVAVVDVLEVIDVEHDERHRRLRAPGAAQLRVDHVERVRAVEAAGEAVAQAVLAHLVKELRVAHRDREQRRRHGQHALPAEGGRRFGNAEHADRMTARRQRDAEVTLGGNRVRRRRAVWDQGAVREMLACALRLAAVLARRAHEHLPVSAHPQQHPRFVGARQLGQVLDDDIADLFHFERAGERLPERDEPLHLHGARLGLVGVGLRRRRARLRFLPLALLMEEKHSRQDQKGRGEREAGASLHLLRQVEQVANRPRKHDEQRDRESAEQHPVLSGHQIHEVFAL